MNQSDQKILFIHASWHTDIVMQAFEGFKAQLLSLGYQENQIDVLAVPGAYEIPLQAQKAAKSGKYTAIACSALVVDGGIYRHDFVAQSVVNALMDVQLDTMVPVLNAVLTPHHFHEHQEHSDYFQRHFEMKGQELASACHRVLEIG